jgi:outer membrane protein insertion porin family
MQRRSVSLKFFHELVATISSKTATSHPVLAVHCLALCILALLFSTDIAIAQSVTHSTPKHYMKFNGVSPKEGKELQKKFPHFFQREVTLAEIDELVRYLMQTKRFSNIDVIRRQNTEDGPHLLLVATELRKIVEIKIQGARAIPEAEVRRFLKINEGQAFERKEVLDGRDALKTEYTNRGYVNAEFEVDFPRFTDTEVSVEVRIREGSPIRISSVVFETANTELKQRLTNYARRFRGQALTRDERENIRLDVVRYLREQRYLTAQLLEPQLQQMQQGQEQTDKSQFRMSFTVESPWRYQFLFEGLSAFSASSLIRNLNLEQLGGSVSTPAPELAEKLRRHYRNAGYAHVEVKTEDRVVAENWLHEIKFIVEEGPRVRIRNIEITGNISRPGSYYANWVRSSSSDLIGQGYYNKADIEEGIKQLERELQFQGFHRAKVKNWRTEFNKTAQDRQAEREGRKSRGSQASVILNIDEGPLTIVRQVKFEGAEAFSRVQLANLLPLKAGQALLNSDLLESIERLKQFYQSQGYLEMQITNERSPDSLVTYNDTSTQATVDFQIYEGPRVVISNIVLEGNDFTQDYVILREIEVQPGDIFTPEAAEEIRYNLTRLGLFSKVEVRTSEEGTRIAERTLVIRVEERDPGLFTAGVGVVQDRDLIFRGYAGFVYRNLYGTGRSVSARIDPSYSTDPKISYLEHKITLGYTEPYIFGDRNRGRLNLVRELKFFEFDDRDRTIIQEKNALGLLIDKDFTKNIKLTFTAYDFSSLTQFDRRSYDIKRTQNIAKVGPLFEFDWRDNIFNPTKGSYSSIGAEYSDPNIGSSEDISQSIKFVKATASTALYTRLWRQDPRWVFANAVRVGYLRNLSERTPSGVPYEESFVLGGRATIRGFDGSDIERVPNLNQLGVANRRDFYMTGESTYYLIKSELRFPIMANTSFGEISGAFFYDGGAVKLTQREFEGSYRDSAGAALRIGVAGGILVSLEYGFKLTRRTWDGVQESPGSFHLSIGTF